MIHLKFEKRFTDYISILFYFNDIFYIQYFALIFREI